MRKTIFILAALMLLTSVMAEARPRQQQRCCTVQRHHRVQPIRFGVKAGFNSSAVDSKYGIDADRVLGIHVGPTAQFSLPVRGLYIDGALLFSQRGIGESWKRDYNLRNDFLDLPILLRYNFPSRHVSPFVSTGPYVAFRITGDKRHYAETLYVARDVATGWDFSLGMDIAQRVQLSLTYDMGLSDTYRAFPGGLHLGSRAYGIRSNTWMFSATVLF